MEIFVTICDVNSAVLSLYKHKVTTYEIIA